MTSKRFNPLISNFPIKLEPDGGPTAPTTALFNISSIFPTERKMVLKIGVLNCVCSNDYFSTAVVSWVCSQTCFKRLSSRAHDCCKSCFKCSYVFCFSPIVILKNKLELLLFFEEVLNRDWILKIRIELVCLSLSLASQTPIVINELPQLTPRVRLWKKIKVSELTARNV